MKQIIITLTFFVFLYQLVAASKASAFSELIAPEGDRAISEWHEAADMMEMQRQEYYDHHEQAPPMVIIPPQPIVPVAPQPRCHTEVVHDDILDTTDWKEVCDD